jgi:hypothetical protein
MDHMMTAAKKQQPQSQPTATPTAQPQPPAPAPAAGAAVQAPVAAAQPQPSKQQVTLMKLSVELAKRDVTVKPEMLKMDGKYLVLNIGEAWPEIRIGNGGGIDLPAIKSYPNAFTAAVEGDKLLGKQRERETKKTALTAAPVVVKVVSTPAPKPEQQPAVSTTTKKRQADAQIEQKLQAQA